MDLAEKLSRLENEMTSKITEFQTEMIESEKLKRSMEILQDGNRLFDTRINSLNYVVRSQRFGTADVHNRTTHRTLAALSRIHVQYYYIYYFFWGFFCDYIVFVVCKLIFVSF